MLYKSFVIYIVGCFVFISLFIYLFIYLFIILNIQSVNILVYLFVN